jgi:hypothetical protein
MKRYNCKLGIVPFIEVKDGYWVTYKDAEYLKSDILAKEQIITRAIEVLEKLERRNDRYRTITSYCLILLALTSALEIVKAFN